MGENTIIEQLKLLNHLMEYGRKDVVKGEQLTQSQCYILRYLFMKGEKELCATDIHMVLGISKASISTLLKGLKQEGYLTMISDPEDDRKKQIRLTKKAYEMEERIDYGFAQMQEMMLKGISQNDRMVLERCLKQMSKNLKEE